MKDAITSGMAAGEQSAEHLIELVTKTEGKNAASAEHICDLILGSIVGELRTITEALLEPNARDDAAAGILLLAALYLNLPADITEAWQAALARRPNSPFTGE